MNRILLILLLQMIVGGVFNSTAFGLDGGTLRINPRNDWKAFEVITVDNNPTVDGFDWSMPNAFDGLGAWLSDDSILRLQVNHEISNAAISEVNLDLASFKTAISNTINSGSTGGGRFVNSARLAYDRWSSDGGATFTNTTDFSRFCSGQSYSPNTFGDGRGFVDDIYITGEEGFGNDRLFALDLNNRDFYQLSGATGSAFGWLIRWTAPRSSSSAMTNSRSTSLSSKAIVRLLASFTRRR
jgi:hypothetical protein